MDSILYSAMLRFKRGEYIGVASLSPEVMDRFLPHFIAPPIIERDPSRKRVITPDEAIHLTARRVAKYWPSRLSLLDVSQLLDPLGRMKAHEWMPELFTIAHRKGAYCSPVLSLTSNSSERLGCQKIFSILRTPLAIRVPIGNTQDKDIHKQIYDIINIVGISPKNALIVLDCNDTALDVIEDAVIVISEAVRVIQSLGEWRNIIVSATSYPTKNPAAKNSECIIIRNEFVIWEKLADLGLVKEKPVIFGDHGADCSILNFGQKGGRGVIPHLRYATRKYWAIFRGGDWLNSEDNGTIRSVASKVKNSEHYDGFDFSAADEFIDLCAAGVGKTGNATTWRQINTNRHITKIVFDLMDMRGERLKRLKRAKRYVQQNLFA
ncbi:beta family protein [Methylobacterium sp. 37f]|uniref:beta family protein n=1 Tax=Methylobacterium sp. 37f TaxID=2817058 RepID=UPI001FFD33D6|nr:beta family protein [Methylobacterium sp. 37f]